MTLVMVCRGRGGQRRRRAGLALSLAFALSLLFVLPSSAEFVQAPRVGIDLADYDDPVGSSAGVPGALAEAGILGVAALSPNDEQVRIPPALIVDSGAPWSRAARCPILYAHEVPTQAALRGVLVGLLSAGYQPTTLHYLEEMMAGRILPAPGCLVLTFDDGLYSQYTNALPVLASMELPAVFFAMPAFADGVHRYMRADELGALRSAGHEVMAHTCNHANLPLLAARNRGAFQAELGGCKQALEEIVGASVPYLAYPLGAYDAQVMGAVANAGFRAAFTTRPSALLPANTPFALPRIGWQVGETVSTVLTRIRRAGG